MTRDLLGESWYPKLKEEMEKEYFLILKEKLREEYKTQKVYPKPSDIFKALQLCPFENVRVVMLSQDPYPRGEAHGLAFSTTQAETPFSLRMIFRELDRGIIKTTNLKEFNREFPTNDLSLWATRGVLLLNTVLTVRSGESGSHKALGWQEFTNKMLQILITDSSTPRVFVIWGSEAKKALMTAGQNVDWVGNSHYILESGHPASGSHGVDKYSGNGHFSKINLWFERQGLQPIEWSLRKQDGKTN